MKETYEDFTEVQKKLLQHFVTNTQENIFVLRNLPEVIKGALFSRYSRSNLGLRSLLLKDFILNEESAFNSLLGKPEGEAEEQFVAMKKAQNFYDRILDGYGDDSIGELGGAHLALENISMLAAKAIEDCRIGGSPLEKSTRYVYFDQKVQGEYQCYREPILMASAYRDLYNDMCNELFVTYGKLLPFVTEIIEKKFPRDLEVSKVAYTAALRAKVLDCLRGILPSSALTNVGVYGNGRFFENLIQKLRVQTLSELQEVGQKSFVELSKVIPSFVRRADSTHKHQKTFMEFREQLTQELSTLATKHASSLPQMSGHETVRLVHYTENAPVKVASALLFPYTTSSLQELEEHCQKISSVELEEILQGGACHRENRRHKSPRALERAEFTFEIVADFGIYRDLQRHRMVSQERQILSCKLDYFIPTEILGTDLEKEYRTVMEKAKEVYNIIASEFPEEAQYVVPMAYNMHWYMHINLRALQWMCELRSSPAGHPSYRLIAQEMAKQVSHAFPMFERFFSFVDYGGYEMGRLDQEIRIAEKQSR